MRSDSRGDGEQNEDERGDVFKRGYGLMATALDHGARSDGPPPSVRSDAFLRASAVLLARSLRDTKPYNPEKKANDAFDTLLLRYLAYPAAVCTSDRRLLALVEEGRSWQRAWMVRPEDLRDPGVVERLLDVGWQHASSQEAP